MRQEYDEQEIKRRIENYDRQAFILFLQKSKDQGGKEQELKTAKDNACFVATFAKSGKSPVDFVKSYSKPNSYNNARTALNHYLDYLCLGRLPLKQKRRSPDSLIIAPRVEEMHRVIREIEELDCKCYIALCSTVGLRPQRLLKAKWSEIDFENGWVNINERHHKKIYRPNPLHAGVAALLQALKQEATTDRVFNCAYKKIGNALKAIKTDIRPNKCRDFYFNHARKSGMDKDQVEWSRGHSLPGVRAHYLADELKTEYAKFEAAFRL